MLKIAVIGSRGFNDYDLMKTTLESYRMIAPGITIVSGGAKGADSLAEKYASEMGLETIIFKPDWKTHGKIAGFLRNTTIIEEADLVIAFWDGESHGTLDSMKKAKKLNKTLIEIKYKEL
jgi:hypothetical protein